MGFIDNLKAKVAQNADKADGAIDKAAKLVNKQTKGKHAKKIHSFQEKAKGAVDKIESEAKPDNGGKASDDGDATPPTAT